MSDRIADAELFVTVVEGGGFSEAARRLGRTPSAVSKQMARLENRLGVRLVQRTTRKLNLTTDGRLFFDRCRTALGELREAEEAVTHSGETARGLLRVTAPVAFCHHQLVNLLPGFLERCPEVEIELHSSDTIVDLIEHGLDVGIRIGGLDEASLIRRPLATNRRLLCAAPAYLEQRGRPETPADLAGHECLNFSLMTHLNDWPFTNGNGTERLRFAGRLSANLAETLFRMALAGLGIARISEFLAGPAVRRGELVRVLETYDQDDSPPIYVVYPHRRHLSPRVRAFVDYLVARCRPVPPWCCEPLPAPV